MENKEEMNESDETTSEEESSESSLSQWFQDNLRIIISVLIVVIIAGGIYSYSNRTETPIASKNDDEQSDIIKNITEDQESTNTDSEKEESKETAKNANTSDKETAAKENSANKNQPSTSSVATSQETEGSFVETAAKGDSQTTLARRALANYLEKNPDSSLTAEHKIYIEDYLRKHTPSKGRMTIGASVEFSKSLIQEAITKSKTLNDNQLKNLHKYAVRVPSLS